MTTIGYSGSLNVTNATISTLTTSNVNSTSTLSITSPLLQILHAIDICGNVEMKGNLVVKGNTTLQQLTCSTDSSFNNVVVGGTITVQGTAIDLSGINNMVQDLLTKTTQYCPAGSYCPNGILSIKLCEAGKYCLAGVTSATLCPAGTYNSSIGSSDCSGCPAGTYNSITGSISLSACLGCPLYTKSASGSTICSPYMVSTLAGTYSNPYGVAVDSSGNVYVADAGNNMILKITPDANGTTVTVSTLAGSGTTGSDDGTGTAAQFNFPTGVAVDSDGIIYVADYGNDRIRKITPDANGTTVTVSTLAGSYPGYVDGTGIAAQFNRLTGVAVDSNRNVYVADYGNNRIRKITPAGVVTTLAGDGSYSFADGTGTAAKFTIPSGVAVDSDGNVYVADYGNDRIRKITPAGVVSTLAGSTQGDDEGQGTAAQFRNPYGVAVDSAGNVYVADTGNHKIRKITPAGDVSTLAGSGTAGSAIGTGTAAQFSGPRGIAVDSAGNVYVADTGNHKILQIT